MDKPLYRDSSRSIDERVEDLLSRMNTQEKLRQVDQYSAGEFLTHSADGKVTGVDTQKLASVLGEYSVGSVQSRGTDARINNALQRYAVEHTRLGIPFLLSEEALHCFTDDNATNFPQQITLASTFDSSLAYDMGRCIAREARSHGICETFSPVMDLARDPRYGRTEETFGEDVRLSADMAQAVVQGLQGEGLARDDTVASEPKHYVGYGNPVGGLNCAPSTMGRHDVYAYCLPVFEAAYKRGGATNAMCSYNSIDGVPVAMDRALLSDVLRDEFGMPGFVRADMTAIAMLHTAHAVAENGLEAEKLAITAGVDIPLYDFPHEEYQGYIKELLESGRISMDVLDTACRRMLRVKFMCGLFENPYTDERLRAAREHCPEHVEKALEIARRGMCLLKNKGSILPLTGARRIAVVGPNAGTAVLGDYSNNPSHTRCITALQGIREAFPESEIVYEKGCNILGAEIKPMNHWWMTSEDDEHGFTARYYNADEISGEPVLTRMDQSVNFNWIYSKPHPDVDARRFCVRWTGKMCPPESFTGLLGLSSQDSMRLYVDGTLLIDAWGDGKDANVMLPFTFEAGRSYDIRIDYRNDGRGVRVIFGYSRGYEDFTPAIEAVKSSDVAIVCVGDSRETSGENFDRATLYLPGSQGALVREAALTGTPVVLVVFGGRPMSLVWEQENLAAILYAWFPGEQGGRALGDVLSGRVNPSGHLPMSFPKSVGQIPCHYSRHPAGGKRYVEMDFLPLYPFGYGLSYTTFTYSALRLSSPSIPCDGALEVSFNIRNSGERAGIAVPQAYIHDRYSSVVKGMKELAGYTSVYLEPGEDRDITFTLSERELRTLGADYVWRVESGDFDLEIGDNSANAYLTASFAVTEE